MMGSFTVSLVEVNKEERLGMTAAIISQPSISAIISKLYVRVSILRVSFI